MKRHRLVACSVAVLSLCACVAHSHRESAALRARWPSDTAGAPLAQNGGTYPSTGGDILRGTSTAELATARTAASLQLTEALAKP